jgi:hypothetical protein
MMRALLGAWCLHHRQFDWRACDRETEAPAVWQSSRLTTQRIELMTISNHIASAKPLLLGAAGGAILLAIVGFTWGGWVSGGTADKMATQRADAAVVQALAPICVQNFRVQVDAVTQLVSLKKLSTYEQRGFVEKGGWAIIPELSRLIRRWRGRVPMRLTSSRKQISSETLMAAATSGEPAAMPAFIEGL